MTRTFRRVNASEFRTLAQAYAGLAKRRAISEVHLHHTWIPSHQHFNDLKRRLGSSEAAGHEQVRRMWRSHVEERKFSDIAQHVTIDPEGGIWLGRAWSAPPASAVGANGTAQRGPFMIEMVGDFDRGRDVLTGAQRAAAVAVIALMQRAFRLPADALSFHNELSAKSCPGTGVDKAAIIAEVAAYAPPTGRGKRAARSPEPAGPLSDDQLAGDEREAVTIDTEGLADLMQLVVRSAGERGGFEEDAELLECSRHGAHEPEPDDGRALPPERGPATARAPRPTPEMLRALRPHVINLTQGRFSDSGLFQSSPASVAQIFNTHLPAWIAKTQGQTPRVVIYAHGGLVDEGQALRQAYAQRDWWLSNGVYPIFFVWETGPLEIPLQALARILPFGVGRDGARAFITDAAWEPMARSIGKPLWSGMKTSAARASEPEGGALLAAGEFARLARAHPDLEVHMVGHSAGSIFACHMIPELVNQGVALNSLQFLAPACTTNLYKLKVMPTVGRGVKRARLLTMSREFERIDPTMKHIGYGKSILYAVANAMETHVPTPILGLEDSLEADPALAAHFGLDGDPNAPASVVWSKSDPDAPEVLRPQSATHGFDWEPNSMMATLLYILGRTAATGLTPFPTTGRNLGALFAGGPWAEVDDALAELGLRPTPTPAPAVASPKPPPTPAYPQVAGARRIALSFGIDAYPDAPLSGCVADTGLWRNLLQCLGYQVTVLTDEQVTRQTLIDRIGALVRDARAGDDVVLHYSGHGTYFPDGDLSEEDDGRDEAIVPVDHLSAGCLLDDDLRALFAPLADGVSFTGFFDCCHSGSNARFGVGRLAAPGGLRARFLRASPQMIDLNRRLKRGRGRGPVVAAGQENMRHAQFAACLDSQVAYEADGFGRFSKLATEVLARDSGLSRKALLGEVERAFVSAGYNDQNPVLEGPLHLKDALVFTPAAK